MVRAIKISGIFEKKINKKARVKNTRQVKLMQKL